MAKIKTTKNYFLLFIFLLVMTYVINLVVFKRDSSGPHISTLSLLIFCTLLLKSKNKIYMFAGAIITFILLLEIFYFLVFKERVSAGVLDSIVETNSKEAYLMLYHYIFSIIVPSILSVVFIVFILNKLLKTPPSFLFRISPILLYLILSASIATEFISNKNRLIADFKEDHKEIGNYIRSKFPAVIGDIIYIVNSIYNNDRYNDIKVSSFQNESIISNNKPKSKLIVLVIGESSYAYRHSAYGYEKETTPNSGYIFSGDNACIVSKVHSSAPITRNSISMTLSFYTPESEVNLFKNKSIIEMAKKQGYKTYWIGSQSLKGVHGSKYGFIALKSDFIKIEENNDDALPSILKSAISDDYEYKFVIVHLWGSHKPYLNFSSNDKKLHPDFDNYDLTLFHTDKLLSEINNVIVEKTGDYTLIYTSDHGEIVGKGHGFQKGIEQYLIPFMYKSTNNNYDCNFIDSFRNNDGWISGLMNKFILSSLLGYSINIDAINKEKTTRPRFICRRGSHSIFRN